MIAGFDIDSPLVCEGVIGDGCGGGRVFFIDANTLKVYDPTSKQEMTLLGEIKNPLKLSKSGCIITIECETKCLRFDLSAMSLR